MDRVLRADQLMRQHIDVALVFQEMVGTGEAVKYLLKHGIPLDAVHRVILSPSARRTPQLAANDPLSHSSQHAG